MIKRANGNKRLISITSGNVRNSHIYITGLRDFFPTDCFGASSRSRHKPGRPITLLLDGLNEVVETDIPRDAKTGRPRRQFRERKWVRSFFRQHGLQAGDVLALEKVGERSYSLSVEEKSRPGLDLTFAEFFAGIGLMRMGLEAEGWKLAFANDIAPQKRQMCAGHFADVEEHYDTTDVHLLDPDNVPTVSLATASFPCTDLSLAGGRKGLKAGQSAAFYGFIDLLRGMGDRRAPLVLLENVLGLLTSHNGQDFREAMLELNALGYIVDVFMLDAKWFVPQSRPRLFVVGALEASGSDGLVPTSQLRPPIFAEAIASNPDIAWRLRRLPKPPLQSEKSLEDILEDLPDNAPEWWSPERAEYLYNQMSPKHRAIADAWIGRNRWSYGTVFRRVRKQPDGSKRSMGELRSDGIAGCLRTPKGGSGRQILFKAGFGKYAARLLTPRECARLMGADDFNVTVPLNQALFGFGDAVCVPAVSWIARHYLNPLAKEFGLAEALTASAGTARK